MMPITPLLLSLAYSGVGWAQDLTYCNNECEKAVSGAWTAVDDITVISTDGTITESGNYCLSDLQTAVPPPPPTGGGPGGLSELTISAHEVSLCGGDSSAPTVLPFITSTADSAKLLLEHVNLTAAAGSNSNFATIESRGALTELRRVQSTGSLQYYLVEQTTPDVHTTTGDYGSVLIEDVTLGSDVSAFTGRSNGTLTLRDVNKKVGHQQGGAQPLITVLANTDAPEPEVVFDQVDIAVENSLSDGWAGANFVSVAGALTINGLQMTDVHGQTSETQTAGYLFVAGGDIVVDDFDIRASSGSSITNPFLGFSSGGGTFQMKNGTMIWPVEANLARSHQLTIKRVNVCVGDNAGTGALTGEAVFTVDSPPPASSSEVLVLNSSIRSQSEDAPIMEFMEAAQVELAGATIVSQANWATTTSFGDIEVTTHNALMVLGQPENWASVFSHTRGIAPSILFFNDAPFATSLGASCSEAWPTLDGTQPSVLSTLIDQGVDLSTVSANVAAAYDITGVQDQSNCDPDGSLPDIGTYSGPLSDSTLAPLVEPANLTSCATGGTGGGTGGTGGTGGGTGPVGDSGAPTQQDSGTTGTDTATDRTATPQTVSGWSYGSGCGGAAAIGLVPLSVLLVGRRRKTKLEEQD